MQKLLLICVDGFWELSWITVNLASKTISSLFTDLTLWPTKSCHGSIHLCKNTHTNTHTTTTFRKRAPQLRKQQSLHNFKNYVMRTWNLNLSLILQLFLKVWKHLNLNIFNDFIFIKKCFNIFNYFLQFLDCIVVRNVYVYFPLE